MASRKEPPETRGEAIRRLREGKKLSRREVEDATGISQRALQYIEDDDPRADNEASYGQEAGSRQTGDAS